MDCPILYNAPATYSDCENQHLKELNNKNMDDEDLIEVSIEQISQSWKNYSSGSDLPVFSENFQDPLDEVATTLNKLKGVNSTSDKPINFTHSDIITGNSHFSLATPTITEEDAIGPVQGVNDIDFGILADLFLKEENGALVPPDFQSQQTSESQAENEVKARVAHGTTEGKKEESIQQTKVPNSGHWNDYEHKLFLMGIERYGRQWRAISNLIKTRTSTQVRTHAQKYFSKRKYFERPLLSSRTEERPVKRQQVDEDEFDPDFSGIRHGRWLGKEHHLFLEGIGKFGRDWRLVATVVKTRTSLQIRTHAQKYFQKVGIDYSRSTFNEGNSCK